MLGKGDGYGSGEEVCGCGGDDGGISEGVALLEEKEVMVSDH